MTRSSAARADAAVERVANQSDITSPSKPHSPCSTSRSSPLSVIGSPPTALYAAMTDHTPASRTTASNGARYSSRSVRSSTRASSVIRSGLGVVGDEVLHGGADAAGLHPAHVGDADPRAQQRVLAEALEVAAAERRAVQVDGRREQHVDALAPALRGQQAAEVRDELLVPGRGERRRRRHVRRRLALVPQLAAHARRAVGDDQPAQADSGLGVQRPEVGTGQQPHLALERQARHAGGEVGVVDHSGSVADLRWRGGQRAPGRVVAALGRHRPGSATTGDAAARSHARPSRATH